MHNCVKNGLALTLVKGLLIESGNDVEPHPPKERFKNSKYDEEALYRLRIGPDLLVTDSMKETCLVKVIFRNSGPRDSDEDRFTETQEEWPVRLVLVQRSEKPVFQYRIANHECDDYEEPEWKPISEATDWNIEPAILRWFECLACLYYPDAAMMKEIKKLHTAENWEERASKILDEVF